MNVPGYVPIKLYLKIRLWAGFDLRAVVGPPLVLYYVLSSYYLPNTGLGWPLTYITLLNPSNLSRWVLSPFHKFENSSLKSLNNLVENALCFFSLGNALCSLMPLFPLWLQTPVGPSLLPAVQRLLLVCFHSDFAPAPPPHIFWGVVSYHLFLPHTFYMFKNFMPVFITTDVSKHEGQKQCIKNS